MAKLAKKLEKVKTKIKGMLNTEIPISPLLTGKRAARKKSTDAESPLNEKGLTGVQKASAGQEKIAVEDAKYYTHPEVRVKPRFALTDLPAGYGKDIIVLQVRDPWWLHAYWEILGATFEKFQKQLGGLFNSAKKVLRVYDVSFISFNGRNAHRFFDVEVSSDTNNWYIDTGGPGRSWCMDYGIKLADGRFITIVRSNVVTTPLDGPSWITDEEWMVPDDLFSRLYGTAVGLGGSPVRIKKPWLELRKRQLASGGLFSGALSPVKKRVGKRQFWLVVSTELIVYGATEANAKVRVCGKPITLRPDGTFTLRFSLPDGKQVIPVNAISFDGVEVRTITPVVTKETK